MLEQSVQILDPNQQVEVDHNGRTNRMGLLTRIGTRFRAAFAAEIIGAISGAILLVVLARLLGPSPYGVLFLAIAIFGLAREFSTFGIHKSAARYVSEYKETDPGQIPHILRVAFLVNLVFIAVVSLTLLVGHQVIADLVGEPELPQYIILGSIFIIFSTLTSFVRAITQGFEEIKVSSVLFSMNKIGRVIFAVGLVLLSYGAIGALVGYIISYALVAIVGLVYLARRGYRRYQPSQIEPELRTRILRYSVPIAVTQSAHTLDQYMDRILVGFFIGPVAVAYYTVGRQVIQFIETPMSALGFTLSPTYSSKKAKGNIETAAQIYQEACGYGVILYIPAATGVIILAEPGIEFILGEDYLGAVPVLQVLSIYAILQSITKLTGEGLDYLGRARERAIIKGLTALLNLILNIILIPLIGVVGAAIASVISFGIYTIFNVYVMYVELDFQAKWLLKQSGYAVLVSGLMAAVVLPLSYYITGLVTLFSVILAGGAVWLVAIFSLELVDLDRILTSFGLSNK